MKIRTDFVTNSSSSSFIIAKKYLDEDQIEAIRQYDMMMQNLGLIDEVDSECIWDIDENDRFIAGYTWMDVVPIHLLFDAIEINEDVVNWGEFEFDLSGKDYHDPYAKLKNPNWRSLLSKED